MYTGQYRLPVDEMQEVRLENLSLQVENESLDAAGAAALSGVALQGCIDALRHKNQDQAEVFADYWKQFHDKSGQTADAIEQPVFVADRPLVENSNLVACRLHLIREQRRHRLEQEFKETKPESAPGDPPIVRFGVYCPGPGMFGACKARVVQRTVLGDELPPSSKQ